MNQPSNKKAASDCYSAGERGWMEAGQRLRAWMLEPILRQLARHGVTPDGITVAAGLIGLGFIPFWLTGHPVAALVCIALHVLLDAIDGPLARYNGTASSRGSFTDTFTDQVVVTGVTIGWILNYPISWNIAAGTTYIFLYALVVAMAMVRNALHIPYSWLVRPRFFFFTALAIDTLFTTNVTLWILLTCIPILGLKTATGFFALRRKL